MQKALRDSGGRTQPWGELGKVKQQVCLSCGAQASSGDLEAERRAYQAKGSHMRAGAPQTVADGTTPSPQPDTLDPSSGSHKP